MIEDEDADDNITNTYNWTLIPLKNLEAKGEIWVGPSYPVDDYAVKMDQDGNGTNDENYPLNYDGTSEAIEATTVVIPAQRGGSFGGIILKDESPKLPDTGQAKIENIKIEENPAGSEIKLADQITVASEEIPVQIAQAVQIVPKWPEFEPAPIPTTSLPEPVLPQNNQSDTLSASAVRAGVDIKDFWPLAILGGGGALWLLRRFIKLK